MKVNVHGLSDVGKKREKNEDTLLLNEKLGLFLVADGMGGHLGGEYASGLAAKTIEEALGQSTRTDIAERFKDAIRLASKKIFEEANRNSNLRGMGTTTVAFLVHQDKVYIANVGDSRAYLIQDSKIQQLTTDHSLVNEQLRAGFITREELKHHKFKNIITRSVGFQTDVEVDLLIRDLKVGDRFFLCSDGLSNLVEDSEILKIVSKNAPKQACQKLVQLANKKGGDDNITVVVAIVEAE